MPACRNCSQPCNCVLSEDGFFAGRTEFGRNFTQIEGAGTTEDPFVIHFQDQELFRPKTAEFRFTDGTAINGGASGAYSYLAEVTPGSSITYESPMKFLIADAIEGHPRYAQATYFIIGASVTFSETADAGTNHKHLIIATERGGSSPPDNVVIAGQTVPGGGGDPLTLSCEGFTPGTFFVDPTIDTIAHRFDILIYQNSGAPVPISDLRVWITQI